MAALASSSSAVSASAAAATARMAAGYALFRSVACDCACTRGAAGAHASCAVLHRDTAAARPCRARRLAWLLDNLPDVAAGGVHSQQLAGTVGTSVMSLPRYQHPPCSQPDYRKPALQQPQELHPTTPPAHAPQHTPQRVPPRQSGRGAGTTCRRATADAPPDTHTNRAARPTNYVSQQQAPGASHHSCSSSADVMALSLLGGRHRNSTTASTSAGPAPAAAALAPSTRPSCCCCPGWPRVM